MPDPENIEAFRSSVTPDLYDVHKYIDWRGIDDQIARFASAIEYLERIRPHLTCDALEKGLREEPKLYELIVALLVIPRGAGFSDGRELPDPSTPIRKNFEMIAQLLLDLGLSNVTNGTADIKSLLRVGLSAQDSLRRRYRVGATIEERISSIVLKAIERANLTTDWIFLRLPQKEWPETTRGKVDHVIAINGVPRIAIDSVFQTASGGRQLRDLSTRYPRLQQDVAENGLSLVLIADGRGLREARNEILNQLFAGVASCLTLRQASDGGLLKEFSRIAETEPLSPKSRSLTLLIETGLQSAGQVTATDLPVSSDQARLALVDYVDRNPGLDLLLTAGGTTVAWKRRELVTAAKNVMRSFTARGALDVLREVMSGVAMETTGGTAELECRIFEIKSASPVIPKKFLVAVAATAISPSILRQVSTVALARVPDSKMAVLLCAEPIDEQTTAGWRTLQRTMATNVIVLDSTNLLEFATSTQEATALLATQLLRQSDLGKTSPFVVNSVTPDRMFFGRESEEAAMLSTLKTNSIALIGGRRIGKTSLMRHAEERLKEAGFVTYFGDCQTVKDWNGFAQVAAGWGVSVPSIFQPANLIDVVKQLKPSGESKLVFLLDEIDQLLAWDQKHGDRAVPEAFFRACRSLSQEAHAQFVFSGERVIASRLWDAQSPHWNFARAIELRQLDSSAARKLIFSPLEALQIDIGEEETFFQLAWSRTNGHPQLLQTLGDKLVRSLNDRLPALRSSVSPDDLKAVADTYAYAEHYLETYWGQATILERLITLLIARKTNSLEAIRDFLAKNNISKTDVEVRSALRMLAAYGMTDPTDIGYVLRLDWFPSAIAFYGSLDLLIDQYQTSLCE
jgi:DpnII restriction endonuclease